MKVISKLFDWLELISSSIFICFLVVVLWFSLKYWTAYIPHIRIFEDRMFSVALIITIATVLGQWLEGRINAIIKVVKRLKQKEVHYGVYE